MECVFESDAELGESPLWSPKEQVLYWVDILGKKIHRFDPQTKTDEVMALDQIVASIALRREGGLIAALKKGFACIDFSKKSYRLLKEVESDLPDNRFNDGKCDRQGRFWAGTMNQKEIDQPSGTLYCLDTDLTVKEKVKEVICSNGLGWSPDNTKMYFVQTLRHTIYVYDFDPKTGKISNPREFAKCAPYLPDGLTVDAKGGIWVALCGEGQIVRYTPEGKIDFDVKVPVPRTTSCAFGSKNLDVLYITTAREHLSASDIKKWPLSGSLFALKTDVRGLPETPFQEGRS